MAQVELGKYRINYQLAGPPDGPTVTFVNGLTQSTIQWTIYVDHFTRRGFRVLAYDMLGQGGSTKPILGTSIEQQVELLDGLLESLEVERTHLAGISFGGVVALRFAIANPDRLQSLVAMSTFSETNAQLEFLGTAMWEGMLEAGLPLLQSLLLPMNFSPAWLAANRAAIPELRRRGYVLNDTHAIQGLVECFSGFESFSSQLSNITCPTLILNGEWDYLTPRSCHEILRLNIPNSRLTIIQHAFHAFTLEFPSVTARVIESFLQEVTEGKWAGDQSVWIANDNPASDPVAYPSAADHTRAIQLATSVGRFHAA